MIPGVVAAVIAAAAIIALYVQALEHRDTLKAINTLHADTITVLVRSYDARIVQLENDRRQAVAAAISPSNPVGAAQVQAARPRPPKDDVEPIYAEGL